MNKLIGVPVVAVAVGVLWPIVGLDAKKAYIELLLTSPNVVCALAAAWAVVVYWSTRRVAEVLFLRAAGEKLRVRDGN